MAMAPASELNFAAAKTVTTILFSVWALLLTTLFIIFNLNGFTLMTIKYEIAR